MKRSLLVVLHGKQASNLEVRNAVGVLRSDGHQVDVRVTWGSGDAARFVGEAITMGVDSVIAGGGDGTVNEVTHALVSHAGRAKQPSLGILPLGTANDFARSAEIPMDAEAALELVVDSKAVPVDVGRIGTRVFLNVATGGFGTTVTVETPEALKRALGGAAYLLTGISRFTSFQSMPGRLRAPGFSWQGSFLVLAVGNGRQAGGGYVLCPEAKINDGLLDVGILPHVEPEELPARLASLLRNGFAAAEQSVIRTRTPWLEIESESPLHLNLDGEPVTGTSLRIESVPGAVRVHLPRSDLLL